MMNCNELFAQLVQRFRSYEDAAVLWICLKEHADVKEYAVSTLRLADQQLCGSLNQKMAHRVLQRLHEQGFIKVSVVRNAKTLVQVNREAVLELLRQPLPARLPACSDKNFPFLEAWNADLSAVAEAERNAQPSD